MYVMPADSAIPIPQSSMMLFLRMLGLLCLPIVEGRVATAMDFAAIETEWRSTQLATFLSGDNVPKAWLPTTLLMDDNVHFLGRVQKVHAASEAVLPTPSSFSLVTLRRLPVVLFRLT
jgi:hypothetical protein